MRMLSVSAVLSTLIVTLGLVMHHHPYHGTTIGLAGPVPQCPYRTCPTN